LADVRSGGGGEEVGVLAVFDFPFRCFSSGSTIAIGFFVCIKLSFTTRSATLIARIGIECSLDLWWAS